VALPIQIRPALAVGSDLKNTFCVGSGGYGWLSAHVGDMDDLATLQAFDIARDHLEKVTGVQPEMIIADQHPGYRRPASGHGRTQRPLTDHGATSPRPSGIGDGRERHSGDEPVIGFAFDGTGYGDDHAVWGGEIMIADYRGYQRAGHLRYVALPGGDAGVRNPCRMALSHLRGAELAWDSRLPSVAACSEPERSVLARQLEIGLNTVPTSSMGRLFDAMSSSLESASGSRTRPRRRCDSRVLPVPRSSVPTGYEFTIRDDEGMIIADPAPVIRAAADDVLEGIPAELIAAASISRSPK
jgi:hydrogenase maturation protein HypF